MHYTYPPLTDAAPIAAAIAELEASANDSAEARAWLAVLADVLDLDDARAAALH